MPPKKKRKIKVVAPLPIMPVAPLPSIVSDILVRVAPQKLKGGVKESDRLPSDFRVHYTFVLSDKCCHSGGKKISVTSNQTLWSKKEDGEDQDHVL